MKKIIVVALVAFLVLGFGKGIILNIYYEVCIAEVIDKSPAHKGGYVYEYFYLVDKDKFYGQMSSATSEHKIGEKLWIRYNPVIPKIHSHYFSINPTDSKIFLLKDSIDLFREYNIKRAQIPNT